MLPRFHAQDYATMGFYLGVLLYVLGTLMIVPLIIAVLFNEVSCVVDFLLGICSCFAFGSLLQMCNRGRLDRRRSYLIASSAWIVVALAAAVPMFASGSYDSVLDSVFDAVSSLTTTGISLLKDVDHMAYSQATWRALLALLGAQGVIVVGLYLGFFGEGSYSSRVNAQARHESLSISLRNTSRKIMLIFACLIIGATLVASLIGLSLGLAPKDSIMNAFWLSVSAFTSNSFVPHQASLIFYHSIGLNVFLAFVMVLGSLNFVIYLLVLQGRVRESFRNTETVSIAIWAGVLIVLVSAVLCRENIYSTISALLNHGTFMTISCMTTCGMQTVYPEQFGITLSDSAVVVLMVACLVGISSCSSGGGIKVFRIGQVLHWIAYTVKSALLPNNAYATLSSGRSTNARRIYPKDASVAMVITVLYIAATGVGAVCFISHGYSALDSISESVSYVSNSGITTGISSAGMATDLKLIALFQMWAGRLEFIALFALLAGLFMSAVPHKENIPSGVKATRLAARRSHRRKVLNQVKHNLFGSDNSNGKKMMAILLVFVLGASTIACFPSISAWAAKTSSDSENVSIQEQENRSSVYRTLQVKDLLGATSRMDKQEVSFTAEAIFSCIKADNNHVWVNMLQDGSEIGVLMSNDDAQLIKNFGSYQTKGDTVLVQGVFNLVCKKHSGELDVHANSIKIVQEGENRTDQYSNKQLIACVLFVLIGVFLILLRRLIYGRWIHIHLPF